MGCAPSGELSAGLGTEKKTGAWPKPLYKDSKLILPKGAKGPLPCVVALHGTVGEGWMSGKLVTALLSGFDIDA